MPQFADAIIPVAVPGVFFTYALPEGLTWCPGCASVPFGSGRKLYAASWCFARINNIRSNARCAQRSVR
ncbi:MAG: hypothetical protein IPG69_04945 [Flavobacteriales bacterium]|nr:hypothetical protein [Flavobacteriales bacterium]